MIQIFKIIYYLITIFPYIGFNSKPLLTKGDFGELCQAQATVTEGKIMEIINWMNNYFLLT